MTLCIITMTETWHSVLLRWRQHDTLYYYDGGNMKLCIITMTATWHYVLLRWRQHDTLYYYNGGKMTLCIVTMAATWHYVLLRRWQDDTLYYFVSFHYLTWPTLKHWGLSSSFANLGDHFPTCRQITRENSVCASHELPRAATWMGQQPGMSGWYCEVILVFEIPSHNKTAFNVFLLFAI